MSGGINFIQGNPAIAAQHEGNRERDRQRQSMLQAEAAGQRNLMDAATAPYQMRQTQAQTSRAEDDARFSRATLGDRITRSNVQATQAGLTGFYESMKLLDQGDAEGARFVAEQYGQQIPEGVFNNRALQRQLSAIADEAQTRYPSNPRKQQEFIQYAVQGLQDETEGASRATDPMYRYTIEGAPQADEFVPSRGGGSGGGNTIYHTRFRLLRENGFSDLEADAIASGRKEPSAQDVVRIADARTRDQLRGLFRSPPPEQIEQMRKENIQRTIEDLGMAGEQFNLPTPRQGQQQGQMPEMDFDSPISSAVSEQPSSFPMEQMGTRLRQIGQGGMPSPQQEAPPPAPQDPSQRQLGMTYSTPDGRLVIWRGDGWELVE